MKTENKNTNYNDIIFVILIVWGIIAITLMLLCGIIDYIYQTKNINSQIPTYLFIASSSLLVVVILSLAILKISVKDSS